MPNPVQNLIKTHSPNPNGPKIDSNGLEHGWVHRDTSHIKNVSLTASHALLECPCGWLGWVKITALEKSTETDTNTP